MFPSTEKPTILHSLQRYLVGVIEEISPLATMALRQDEPRAILENMGIDLAVAQEMGVGYIPALTRLPADLVREHPQFYTYWADRLIFPMQSASGIVHYAGVKIFTSDRCPVCAATLPSAPQWLATHREAFFHWDAAQDPLAESLVLVNTPLDALRLLSVGIPNVASVGTTGIDPGLLSSSIVRVVVVMRRNYADRLVRRFCGDDLIVRALYTDGGDSGSCLTSVRALLERRVYHCQGCGARYLSDLCLRDVHDEFYCEECIDKESGIGSDYGSRDDGDCCNNDDRGS